MIHRASVLFACCLLSGCFWANDPEPQQLRIRNVGSTELIAVGVYMPEAFTSFGDVPIGATTGYVAIPGGVYSYAAFRFNYDGDEVTQPVQDFVGEVPMKGRRFTYELELVTTSFGPAIAIKNVIRDR